MTHTTTDVAEARALDIARKAAALVFDERTKKAGHPATAGMERYYAKVIRAGEGDGFDAVQSALIAVRLATAEAASGAGEREGLPAKAVWFRFNASTGEYENEYCSVKPHDASGFVAMVPLSAALASLPPATDPAISGLSSFPPNWKLRQMHFSAPCSDDRKWHVNVYGGREGGDTFVGRGTSADEALRDAARNARAALAAVPTIPATGEAIPEGMKPWRGGDAAPSDWDGGKVLFRDGKIEPYSHKDHICWCHKEPNPSDIIAYTPKATIPATGHAATEGEG